MGRVKQLLTDHNYNLRERATIYASPILGAAAGLTFSRYMLFPKTFEDPITEALSWGLAAIGGLPFEFVGAVVGGVTGLTNASFHRQKRSNKERLENITDNTNTQIGGKN